MARARRRRRRGRRGRARSIPLAAVLGTAAFALALIAVFVFFVTRPTVGGEPEAACVIVVDRTSSSGDSGTRSAYATFVTQAVNGCADANGELSAFYFDQSNEKLVNVNGSDEPYSTYLALGNNAAALQRQKDEAVETAIADILTTFDLEPGEERQSDVLSAFVAAAGNLQSLKPDSEPASVYLVMITDGIQLGSTINMSTLTDPEVLVEPLVESAVDLELIPNLDGVDVSFVGVRSGKTNSGEQIPEWFESRVEQFWRAITELGNGSMCFYEPTSSRLPQDC